jgi:hypothetical protein
VPRPSSSVIAASATRLEILTVLRA